HQYVKARRKHIVELVQRVKPVIGIRNALSFFDISVSTFRQWCLETQAECFQSAFGTCNRIYQNQLSRTEVVKMKEKLTSLDFRYWPVSSIAYYALRHNVLPVSLNTWYKYARKLGISRTKALSRRKKNAQSVRAVRPHEIWHADVTEFTTDDGVRNYIYLVADNYSRKILTWLVAPKVKADFRRVTIVNALSELTTSTPVTLITDCGPENSLVELIRSVPMEINHQKALLDVHYSNSLIEAHNKLLKYNYLYNMTVRDPNHLNETLRWVIADYNNRPHVSLDGLTPNEACENKLINKQELSLHIQRATKKRKILNQVDRCDHCKE
ncbi:MAG TPA: DDE-type integrase/transposase/recombinase, partial [Chryseosolibacter sp.]|nr:DDE-type integrase/transposase/recombinase [Chryseosolibacter sp.]